MRIDYMIAVFVPLFKEIEKPYISMPALIGYLKKCRIKTKAIDANIEFHDYIFEDSVLYYIKEEVDYIYHRLNSKVKMEKNQYAVYAWITWLAVTDLEHLIRYAKKAYHILHSEKFYERDSYFFASTFVRNIIKIIEILTTDNEFTTAPYNNIQAVERILHDKCPNIYSKFYKSQLIPEILLHNDTYVNIFMDFHSQFIPGLILAKMLKEENANLKVTLSGDLCPRLIDTCTKYPEMFSYIDGVITNDYEETIKDICFGKPIHNLDNYIYSEAGVVKVNQNTARSNIINWGNPDYSDLLCHNYFAPELELTVYTSYGCYWSRCAFCNIYIRCLQYHEKPVDLVIEEIEDLVLRYDSRLISFGDEEIKASRLYEIALGLIQRNLNISWIAQSRFDEELEEEKYKVIRQSGCIYLGFGLESGNEEILQKMDTGFHLGSAESILKKVHRNNIVTNVSIVVGFPSESDSQWRDTIEFLKKNKDYIDSILPLCYCITKNSIVDKNRLIFGIGTVYDEQIEETLLLAYPNYMDVKPDWREREERLIALNAELKEILHDSVWGQLPKSFYTNHGEVISKQEEEQEFLLVQLEYDITEMNTCLKYNYSGDWILKENHIFHKGEFFYIADIKNNSWLKISKTDYIVLNHIITNGTISDLTIGLDESESKVMVTKLMCRKKYDNYLKYLKILENITV